MSPFRTRSPWRGQTTLLLRRIAQFRGNACGGWPRCAPTRRPRARHQELRQIDNLRSCVAARCVSTLFLPASRSAFAVSKIPRVMCESGMEKEAWNRFNRLSKSWRYRSLTPTLFFALKAPLPPRKHSCWGAKGECARGVSEPPPAVAAVGPQPSGRAQHNPRRQPPRGSPAG